MKCLGTEWRGCEVGLVGVFYPLLLFTRPTSLCPRRSLLSAAPHCPTALPLHLSLEQSFEFAKYAKNLKFF